MNLLLRALVPTCILFCAATSGRSQEQKPFAVLPGGVADPAGKVGYVHAQGSGVDALDLASGKVLWQVSEFCKPLALTDTRLICQAPQKGKSNAVRILVLDTRNKGKILKRSNVIDFPPWVPVTPALGRSFASHASFDAKGNLLLHWEATAWYVGGARPTPEMEQRASRHAKGVARIDLDTGRVSTADAKEPKLSPVELPKELWNIKPAAVYTHTPSVGWLDRPLRVGKKAVVLVRSHTGGRDQLKLVAWEPVSGKIEVKAELIEGKWLFPRLSDDRRHVFIRQSAPKLSRSDYAWFVFDLETGKRVAGPLEAGEQGLTVIGSRIYYQDSVRGDRVRPDWPQWHHTIVYLKAIENATGRQLWQHRLWTPPPLPPGTD